LIATPEHVLVHTARTEIEGSDPMVCSYDSTVGENDETVDGAPPMEGENSIAFNVASMEALLKDTT
jgi:hypothetical protein